MSLKRSLLAPFFIEVIWDYTISWVLLTASGTGVAKVVKELARLSLFSVKECTMALSATGRAL